MSDLDLGRLAALLELASSPYDAESASAARAAHRLVRAAGKSWQDILLPDDGVPQLPPRRWREPEDEFETLAVCEQWFDFLSTWEQRFVRTLPRFRRWSDRQVEVLEQIIDKLRRAAKAEEYSS